MTRTHPPFLGRGSGSKHYHRGIRVHLTWEQVAVPYLRGDFCQDIARRVGVSPETIRFALMHFGIPRRPRGAGAVPPEQNRFWRGGRMYQDQKYWATKIATYCLGRALPRGAVIHHIDENPRNNNPDNLIVFPNNTCHLRCHFRLSRLGHQVSTRVATQTALESGGQALRRPSALAGWTLDTVPPVLSGSPVKRMPDPKGFRWGRRVHAQPRVRLE